MYTKSSIETEEQAIKLFISYAFNDENLKEQLEKHLAVLKITHKFTTWHGREILPGDEWEKRIAENLNSANIILLLISPDFASSDYCWNIETPRALERHKEGEARVIPVILRTTSGWRDTPLGRLKALPVDGKPVTSWQNPDEAFNNIAEGMRKLLNSPENLLYVPEEMVTWTITVEGNTIDYTPQRINELTLELCNLTNDTKLSYHTQRTGSVKLEFTSTRQGYTTLREKYENNLLNDKLSVVVTDLSKAIGALVRFEARIVDDEIKVFTNYLPEIFGQQKPEDGFPPLVGGISFSLNNFLQMGFHLLTDPAGKMPSPELQLELQSRLGRYLNTFLVLSGDISVSLSPFEEYCGLPKLLRGTELGRDMLAQDIVLKYYTCSILHPLTELGRSFWNEWEAIAPAQPFLEACFRVWIVPDNATVEQKVKGEQAHIMLKKVGLRVLCEADYETLSRNKKDNSRLNKQEEYNSRIISLFKESVLPTIQKEVSNGPLFGILRQIFSVMIMAKWIRESNLGPVLKRAGFMDSDDPERFKLNRVGDEPLRMKEQYLKLFKEGVWRCTRNDVNIDEGRVTKRLYVAGGIYCKNKIF